MSHVSEVLVPGLSRPVLLCRSTMPKARGMAAYVRDGYGAFRQPKFECGCCEMLVLRVCVVRQNLYVYSLYRNPDLDDRIFYCLLASILLLVLMMHSITDAVSICDLSHHRSVAVLCMLYKIRCNPKHPLCGALPVPYVAVRVSRGALIAHRYTFGHPRCRTSQYRRTFILLSVSL